VQEGGRWIEKTLLKKTGKRNENSSEIFLREPSWWGNWLEKYAARGRNGGTLNQKNYCEWGEGKEMAVLPRKEAERNRDEPTWGTKEKVQSGLWDRSIQG